MDSSFRIFRTIVSSVSPTSSIVYTTQHERRMMNRTGARNGRMIRIEKNIS